MEERNKQTWSTIISTSLTTESIFWQKTVAVTHLTLSLSVIMGGWAILIPDTPTFFHIFLGISFLQWMAIWIGLKVKKNAAVCTMIIAILLYLFPILSFYFADVVFFGYVRFLYGLASPFCLINQGFHPIARYGDQSVFTIFLFTLLFCFAAYKSRENLRNV